jgi:uncharacterized membrane protein YfcA
MITIVLLGIAVGIVLALTGAGGGILAVPLLVFATGIGVVQAAPIGLVAVGLGAGLGALLGLRAGIVRYRAALLVAVAGMLLAPLGIWIAHRIDNRALLALFALVLCHVAWNSYRKASGTTAARLRQPVCIRNPATGRFVWTTPCARALAQAGGVAGLLSGLLGVGGGFVIVPALRRFSDLTMASSVATSLAVIFLVSLHAVGLAIATGTLQWAIALPFCTGTLAGMLAGCSMAARVADAFVHKMFATLAALVAAGMLAVTLFPGARLH